MSNKFENLASSALEIALVLLSIDSEVIGEYFSLRLFPCVTLGERQSQTSCSRESLASGSDIFDSAVLAHVVCVGMTEAVSMTCIRPKI